MKFKVRLAVLLSGLLPLLMLLSCGKTAEITSSVSEEAVEPLSTPTPEPTPETVVVPAPEMEAAEAAFLDCYYSVPSEYSTLKEYQALGFPERLGLQDILERRETVTLMDEKLLSDAVSRAEAAFSQLEELYPDSVLDHRIETENCGWKYIGSLLDCCSGSLTGDIVYQAAAEALKQDDGSILISITIQPKNYQQMLYSLVDGQRDIYLHARFLMNYLTTVYDELGEEKDYVQPVLDDDYVEAMGKPLKTTRFYDRWYQGRSRNTRKHTGLDMHASKGADIYSCTDGTVLFIGFDETAGFYVVVLDDMGYEYHYYHMVSETDFLEEGQYVHKGDLIGHVGDTGNSSVYHLHLTLVTPDNVYVRLYDIMKEKYGF